MRTRFLKVLLLVGAVTPAHAALVISGDPTSNVSCVSGVCSATAANAVLNVTDLAGMLASSNVTVKSGSVAQDIGIEASLSWTSANRLALDSFHSIAFDAPVVVAGPGGLTIVTNDGGTGGDFAFASGADVDFWDMSSSLVVEVLTYTLEPDLPALSSAVASNPSGHYALAKSYDASIDGVHKSAPMQGAFGGGLEGLGHTISNLTVHTSRNADATLFEQTSKSAILRDLVMTNVSMKGRSAAAFVDLNYGAIIQCSMSGTVEGIGFVGGIAGDSFGGYVLRAHAAVQAKGLHGQGTVGGIAGVVQLDGSGRSNPVQGIYQSDATGSVSGWDAGGIVGHVLGVTLDHTRAAVNVTGLQYAGGIAGTDYGAIQYSSANGGVSVGDNGYAGGLVGYEQGGAGLSYATGSVRGGLNSNVGGFMGGGFSGAAYAYAMGDVRGGTGSKVGGFAGSADILIHLSIKQSYSTGAPHAPDGAQIGGLIADARGLDPTADYFDTTTSGVKAKKGAPGCSLRHSQLCVIGLTDAQLKSGLPSGFDPGIWGQSASVNNGYPYLLANSPAN